jgi:hypothetical protein
MERHNLLGRRTAQFADADELYPSYESTIEILSELNIPEDFIRQQHNRFGHRKTPEKDIWFVANRTGSFQATECMFRAEGEPELWIGTSGETRKITDYSVSNGVTTIPLEFFPFESLLCCFQYRERSRIIFKPRERKLPGIHRIDVS